MQKHLDLFSGIGGFAIATETVWKGIEHTFCDNDLFAQAVLRKHWATSPIYGDIRHLDGRKIGPVDILTGGFPCQPFSSAGLRKGTEDDRHLWGEMLRLIRETTPRWVVGENVSGLLTWNGGMVLDQVFTDLEAEGYQVWAFIIPAVSLNAPHRRDRVWIVAHSNRSADGGKTRGHESESGSEGVQERDFMGKFSESGTLRDDSNTEGIGQRGRGSEERGESERVMVASESEGSAVRSETQGCDSDVADTTSDRRERRGESTSSEEGREQESRTEGQLQGRPERPHSDATDPESGRTRECEQEGTGAGQSEVPSGDEHRTPWDEDWYEVATTLCAVDDGLSTRLVRPKGWRNAALKAAGNAIVPQVATQVMLAIKYAEESAR